MLSNAFNSSLLVDHSHSGNANHVCAITVMFWCLTVPKLLGLSSIDLLLVDCHIRPQCSVGNNVLEKLINNMFNREC